MATSHNQEPDEHELKLMRVIAQQSQMTVEQLARFMDVYVSDMHRWALEMESRGWVRVRGIVTGLGTWVWLRSGGYGKIGAKAKTFTPGLRELPHSHAINEVRVKVGRSGVARWKSEGDLLRDQRSWKRAHVPDAVVEVGKERHAIEVELSRKEKPALDAKIWMLEERFDLVVYFVAPLVKAHFDRLGVATRHPKLEVRMVEAMGRRLIEPEWRISGDPAPYSKAKIELTPSEFDLEVFDRLAEQMAIPMDQLMRFFGLGRWEAEELVSKYVKARMVMRARPLVGKPVWVWLPELKRRVARIDVRVGPPRLGVLERLRALNEIRLLVEEGGADANWVSERVLLAERSGGSYPPHAVVEVDGERHAVRVVLSRDRLQLRVGEFVEQDRDVYDRVMLFGNRQTMGGLRRFVEERGDERVRVRGIPGSDLRGLRSGVRKAPTGRNQRGGRKGLRGRIATDVAGAEVPDELWPELRMMIPPFEDPCRRGGLGRLPDRAVVSALLWLLRREEGWAELPSKYGSEAAMRNRLRQWEAEGVWGKVRDLLCERLQDGGLLDWDRLKPRGARERRW